MLLQRKLTNLQTKTALLRMCPYPYIARQSIAFALPNTRVCMSHKKL